MRKPRDVETFHEGRLIVEIIRSFAGQTGVVQGSRGVWGQDGPCVGTAAMLLMLLLLLLMGRRIVVCLLRVGHVSIIANTLLLLLMLLMLLRVVKLNKLSEKNKMQ